MKLEVGMYCYNKTNRKLGIGEIISFQRNNNVNIKYKNDIELVSNGNIEASNNIKDLIEVGDIITYEFPTGLGMLRYENVTVLEDLLNILKSSDEYKILTIITREQIESMQYKVD